MYSDDFAAHVPPHLAWVFAKEKGRKRHPRQDDLERLAAVRHLRGGPHFGPGPMFGGPFGGGRGRKRRGDARIALLLLLAEEPRNGYQLMQTIEERSGGHWRPSPGSVYPALAQLEDEGLIRPTERDGAKLFEITDAGREYLEQRAEGAPPWEVDDDPSFQSVSDIRSLMKQVHIAAMMVAQAGDEQQLDRAAELLGETRRGLYRILAENKDE
jgi:DNA-binding PadR family transcriptional regulator